MSRPPAPGPRRRTRSYSAHDHYAVADAPHSIPPEAYAYANPYVAGAVTMDVICDGVRAAVRAIRRIREVRRLDRIGVLPPDWDAAGRHCSTW